MEASSRIDFHGFHMLIIVIQKEDLQHPDQKYDADTDCQKADPEPEFDAVGIEFNLRTQICTPPL